MKRVCFLLLLVLNCSTFCYAMPKNAPTGHKQQPNKQQDIKLELPLTSHSLSKHTVDGYFCSLRCDFLYDGSSNRYLKRLKFEILVKKEQTSWSWLCKAEDKDQPGAFVCEGERTQGAQPEPLPSFAFQWQQDAYNLTVCKDFITRTAP